MSRPSWDSARADAGGVRTSAGAPIVNCVGSRSRRRVPDPVKGRPSNYRYPSLRNCLRVALRGQSAAPGHSTARSVAGAFWGTPPGPWCRCEAFATPGLLSVCPSRGPNDEPGVTGVTRHAELSGGQVFSCPFQTSRTTALGRPSTVLAANVAVSSCARGTMWCPSLLARDPPGHPRRRRRHVVWHDTPGTWCNTWCRTHHRRRFACPVR